MDKKAIWPALTCLGVGLVAIFFALRADDPSVQKPAPAGSPLPQFTRKLPGSHKHRTVGRCLNKHGRWVRGCM